MTTVGAAGYSSQQPSQYSPELAISNPAARIWLTTGNTDVVYDASCHPSSCVVVTPTTNPTGFWKVVASQGSFTVTSSASESAGLTYNYTLI